MEMCRWAVEAKQEWDGMDWDGTIGSDLTERGTFQHTDYSHSLFPTLRGYTKLPYSSPHLLSLTGSSVGNLCWVGT